MKKLTLLLTLLAVTKPTLHAQHFKGAGNGFTVRSFFHQQGINYYLHDIDSQGNIYAVYYDTVTSGFNFGSEYSQVRIQVYDGISWLLSKPIKLFSKNTIYAPRILDIKIYNDDIYLCGSFDSSQGNLGAGIIRFSNRSWKSAGVSLIQSVPNYFEVNHIISFGKNLCITGNFDSIPGSRVNGLVVLDSIIWWPVGNAGMYGFRGNSSTANVSFSGADDSLYAFNKNRIYPDSIEIGGTISKKVAVFRNGKFTEINTPAAHIAHVTSYKNRLVIIPTSSLLYIHSIMALKNGGWTSYTIPDSFYTTNLLGTVTGSGIMYLAFQNPGTRQINVYAFDGNKISRKSSFKIADTYLGLESRSVVNMMSLSGNFNFVKQGVYTDSSRVITRMAFNPACVLSGITFLDQNTDGIKQAGEPAIPYAKVSDASGNYVCQSDGNGQFNIVLPLGLVYSFNATHYHGFESTGNYNFSPAKDSSYNADLGLVHSDFDDAGIAAFCHTANKARQGFVTRYTVFANNYSNTDKNISIRITHDKRCASVNAVNFTPVGQGPGTFLINKSIAAQSEAGFEFSMVYGVDSFSLGEKVHLTAALQSQDVVTKNNIDTITQKVVSAFDPNIKDAHPSAIVSTDNEIKYTIFFQNEGNDTAINVTVVDTLGSLFDLRKVVYRSVSHPQSLDNGRPSVVNNVLIWHFSNIKLPPKKVDSVRSIGYVLLSSHMSKNARIGDSILNKAAIFFDYQKPVITNKAKVVIVRNTGITDTRATSFDIYPNPNNGTLFYKNPFYAGDLLEVSDVTGKIVYSVQVGSEGTVSLPEGLDSGVYFLRLGSNNIDIGKMVLTR